MKLIAGLGNPGRRYEGTRHNVGFAALDEVAQRAGAGSRKRSFQGELADATLGGQRCWLLWPATYMNRSGGSLLEARDFYKLDHGDILVVCDDFNLPLGTLRVRPKGSSGGQRGLEDIIRRLGDDIPRLRIGIGPVPDGWDPPDFVLGKFSKDEREEADRSIMLAADAVETWVREGIERSMNQYNIKGG